MGALEDDHPFLRLERHRDSALFKLPSCRYKGQKMSQFTIQAGQYLQAEEIQNQLFKEQNQSVIPGRRLSAAGEAGLHAATPYEMRLE